MRKEIVLVNTVFILLFDLFIIPSFSYELWTGEHKAAPQDNCKELRVHRDCYKFKKGTQTCQNFILSAHIHPFHLCPVYSPSQLVLSISPVIPKFPVLDPFLSSCPVVFSCQCSFLSMSSCLVSCVCHPTACHLPLLGLLKLCPSAEINPHWVWAKLGPRKPPLEVGNQNVWILGQKTKIVLTKIVWMTICSL
jgi:hypothetical protein